MAGRIRDDDLLSAEVLLGIVLGAQAFLHYVFTGENCIRILRHDAAAAQVPSSAISSAAGKPPFFRSTLLF